MIISRFALAGVCVVIPWQPARSQPTSPPPSPIPALNYDAEFFPGAQHDPVVTSPDAILGFAVGSKPATHAQIEAVIKSLADTSPRCRLFEYAKSYEGRTLHYLVI